MALMNYDALVREIDRITTSPYPSQLRTLLDLVSQCTDGDISQWAASKPCVIESLASCLLEGLQQWSYVLDIITKFAFNAECRDAFLRREPTLLHSVVAQAVKSGNSGAKYTRGSVALLSLPLPDTVALPAEVQTLFVQLVEAAAKRPSSATIEPVYLLLTGTGSLLLGILNTETLIQFEEHLLHILRGGSGAPDQSLSLYCLSIMNVVCSLTDSEFRSSGSSFNTQDFLASTPTSSKWKSEAMQQFFTGNKAARSIQLIVLLVLWAVGKGSGCDKAAEKIKSLNLANEVITAIPPDIRKNWCTGNAIMVRKLQEKLCAEGQEETTKILALRFLGKLCELDSLPHPVLESIELTFLEPRSVHLAHTLCPRMEDCELFSEVLTRAPIGLLLQNAVEYTIRAESAELAAALYAVAQTVRNARMIIEEQKITGHEIRATLNDATFVQSLERLRDLLQVSMEHRNQPRVSGWCRKALHRMRSNLAHQISDVLLRACQSSSMSPHNMTILLSLHASSARGDLECSHDKLMWRYHINLAEGNDEVSLDVLDWREALQTHFQARASVEQDAVTRLFAKACADLEARCENVEKPLREEQEKCRSLQQHNMDLEAALGELESRNVDHVIQARSLEDERDQHLLDLEQSHAENSELLDRITQLEQKVRDAHILGEKQLAEINEAKEMAALDGAVALAKKEEQLDDLKGELEHTSRDAAAKDQDIAALQGDLATTRKECDLLHNDLTTKNGRLEDLNDTLANLERRNEELKTTNTQLHGKLNSAASDHANQSQQLTILNRELQTAHSEHEQTKQSLSHKAEALQKDFSVQLEAAKTLATQHLTAKQILATQLDKLHQDLQDYQSSATSNLDARNARISELKKKVENLQQKCHQKDAQISEAESMRVNLMAAMGLTQASLPHRSRTDSSPLTPTSGDVEEQQPNVSFSSQECTPKRPRPRNSPPVKPRMTKSLGGKGTQSLAARRQTLGVVSGNERVERKVVTPAKGGVVEDIESTFDGGELFTGTQGGMMGSLDLEGEEGAL